MIFWFFANKKNGILVSFGASQSDRIILKKCIFRLTKLIFMQFIYDLWDYTIANLYYLLTPNDPLQYNDSRKH